MSRTHRRVLPVLAAVLAAAGCTNTSPDTEPAVEHTVTVAGEPLPFGEPDAPSDPAIGMAAPSIISDAYSVTPGDGQPKLIVFAARWCGVCNDELPHLVDEGANDGLADVDAVATVDDCEALPLVHEVLLVSLRNEMVALGFVQARRIAREAEILAFRTLRTTR